MLLLPLSLSLSRGRFCPRPFFTISRRLCPRRAAALAADDAAAGAAAGAAGAGGTGAKGQAAVADGLEVYQATVAYKCVCARVRASVCEPSVRACVYGCVCVCRARARARARARVCIHARV